jgi:hypothetical protein
MRYHGEGMRVYGAQDAENDGGGAMMRTALMMAGRASWIGLLAAGLAFLSPAGGGRLGAPSPAAAATFPDVPPWHWAYQGVTKIQEAGIVVGYPTAPAALVQNSLTQIFDGFSHAQAAGAREWVERFTYNRPADWPGPFARHQVLAFSLGTVSIAVSGSTATAAFDPTVALREGAGTRSVHTSMRVRLRLANNDWQADYATLAAGNPLFR